jgi:arylsulfatase A-like enzyme
MSAESQPKLRTYLPLCLLLGLATASLDGIGHFFVRAAEGAPGVSGYMQLFTATLWMYLLLSLVLWTAAWIVLVKLGGVRPAIAFFFIALFLLIYTTAVGVAEVFFEEALLELWVLRPFVIGSFGAAALAGSAIISLITGRLTARKGGARIAFAPCMYIAGLLFITAMGVYVVRAFLAEAPAAMIIAAYGTAVAILALFILLLRRHERILGWTALALVIALLIPTPWTIAIQRETRRPPAFTPQSHDLEHIVLITVDTLRHDVVTTHNAETGLTTHMDRLARDGVAFVNTYTTSPWTLPAIASLMTGMSPRVHRAVEWSSSLPPRFQTLAEYLSDAGYRTGAVGNSFFIAPHSNMDQGFHKYQWYPTPAIKAQAFRAGLAHWLYSLPLQYYASTEDMTDLAIAWMTEHAEEDFFFWIHYYDPHLPYTPPKEYLTDELKASGRGSVFWNPQQVRGGLSGRTLEERNWTRSLYECEVRYVDDNIGRLLDSLEGLGIYDDALVVLTSDHGEEFWEHGGFGHGHTLYNEVLKIPLFVKPPGSHNGGHIEAPVSTQAIMPTILELAGIEPEHRDGATPSFAPSLGEAGTVYAAPPIVSGALLYYDDKESVVFDEMKYLQSLVTDREQLFNLTEDTQELSSLTTFDKVNLERGRALLDAATTRSEEVREAMGIGAGDEADLDQQDIEILGNMGYF